MSTLEHFSGELAGVAELDELVGRLAPARAPGTRPAAAAREPVPAARRPTWRFPRRRYPGDPAVVRLEDLVARARLVVYAAARGLGALRFFATGYWRLVAERPLALAVSASSSGARRLGRRLGARGSRCGGRPRAGRVPSVPSRAPGRDPVFSAAEEAGFSAEIFVNNIRVTLLAWAAGIAGGLLTAAILMLNGVLLGAIAGLVGRGQRRAVRRVSSARTVCSS